MTDGDGLTPGQQAEPPALAAPDTEAVRRVDQLLDNSYAVTDRHRSLSRRQRSALIGGAVLVVAVVAALLVWRPWQPTMLADDGTPLSAFEVGDCALLPNLDQRSIRNTMHKVDCYEEHGAQLARIVDWERAEYPTFDERLDLHHPAGADLMADTMQAQGMTVGHFSVVPGPALWNGGFRKIFIFYYSTTPDVGDYTVHQVDQPFA